MPGDAYSIDELLGIIENETNLPLVYSINYIPENTRIIIKDDSHTLSSLLSLIEKQTALKFLYRNDKLLLFRENENDANKSSRLSFSGFVKDGQTGEILIGASIWVRETSKGSFTDENGFFRLDFDTSFYNRELCFSYIGFKELCFGIDDFSGFNNDILLFPENELDEVLISEFPKKDQGTSLWNRGEHNIYLNHIPGSLGSSDLLRELSFLPGINRSNDLASGISVRGLGSAQNHYLLDGLAIYEPNHAFGLYGVFNEKAINNVQVFKSDVPLHYLGRISSVISNQLKSGNYKDHQRQVGLSMGAVDVQLDGPLLSRKTSYIVNARKSLLNLYLPGLLKKYDIVSNSDIDFYDLTFKLTHRINQNHQLELLTFHSDDAVSIGNNDSMRQIDNAFAWENHLLGLKWKAIFNDKISSTFQLGSTSYQSKKSSFIQSNEGSEGAFYISLLNQSKVNDLIVRQRVQYYPNNNLRLAFGVNFTRHDIRPALYEKVTLEPDNLDPILESNTDSLSYDMDFFTDIRYQFSSGTIIKSGLGFNILMLERDQHFSQLNPYFSILQSFGQWHFFKAGLQRLNQNIHLLRTPGIGIASDLWFQSNELIPPESMWQANLEYNGRINDQIVVSTETYYRLINNLIAFESAGDLFDPAWNNGSIIPLFSNAKNWEERISSMSGNVWGLENTISYTRKKIDISLSYTYSRSKFQLNDDEDYFPGDNDLTHSFRIFGQFILNPSLKVYASWLYQSGPPFTLPGDAYLSHDDQWIISYKERNKQRMGDYQSLKAGISYTKAFDHIIFKLDAGINNLYDHDNPLYVYLQRQGSNFGVQQVNGFPLLPFLYTGIKF